MAIEYKAAPAPTHDGTPLLSSDPNLTVFDAMMAWEDGNISEGDAIALFQQLVDSGMAWSLQGSYGRQAQRFIDAGLVQRHTLPAAGISDFYAMGEDDAEA